MKKNIIFYFSDQQRWDTVDRELTPNLCQLANEGVKFENNFTCQPVCGPARACLQTGLYATQCGCNFNGIPLSEKLKTLGSYFQEAGYQTAYVGKWHLASKRGKGKDHYETKPIPQQKMSGYGYRRVSDVLEFTSHGYDGYVFDEDGNKLDFKGYRADRINDFALEFLENRDREKPFFLFVSQLEPHQQNDRKCFEGYKPTIGDYKNYPIPSDLSFLKGDYRKMYPDYLSAVNRLDYNVGKLVEKLKTLGIYDDTVIVYTSDHGCHFKTRNAEYKRSPHDASIHTPLIIKGGGFDGGTKQTRLTSLIDIPPTLLSLAGIDIPKSFMGYDLSSKITRDCVFVQVSEASNSRAVRTKKYKYSVRDIFPTAFFHSKAKIYFEDYLYDLEKDPDEKVNLIKKKDYKQVKNIMKELLLSQMTRAGEKKPLILPCVFARKK